MFTRRTAILLSNSLQKKQINSINPKIVLDQILFYKEKTSLFESKK